MKKNTKFFPWISFIVFLLLEAGYTLAEIISGRDISEVWRFGILFLGCMGILAESRLRGRKDIGIPAVIFTLICLASLALVRFVYDG